MPRDILSEADLRKCSHEYLVQVASMQSEILRYRDLSSEGRQAGMEARLAGLPAAADPSRCDHFGEGWIQGWDEMDTLLRKQRCEKALAALAAAGEALAASLGPNGVPDAFRAALDDARGALPSPGGD